MPVATSYPGVYIEELPSSSHSVTAAPTSVAVFIGYINPFCPFWATVADPTNPPAVLLLSFADYEAYFGSFFSKPVGARTLVGQAVFQFFQNGGATAYVVPHQRHELHRSDLDAAEQEDADRGGDHGEQRRSGRSANNFQLTALQPVASAAGQGTPMTLTISNLAKSAGASANDLADLTLIYGSTVETYRRLPIGDLASLNVLARGWPPFRSRAPLRATTPSSRARPSRSTSPLPHGLRAPIGNRDDVRGRRLRPCLRPCRLQRSTSSRSST